ncbi:MAG: peroxidase-related enzyme [Bacteroidetes bacterium]|nr:peroxidase-related enzyme [Bacteroidota bacterium]MCH8232669.1 peroxidase-related enzyme [Bacteroidota bacterium]
MPYIRVIPHEQAEGNLRKIYDSLVKTRGKLAEIHQIQSLNPESIVTHMDLYLTIMFGKSPVRRYQREMMAVVVSAANKCPYCVAHHGEALNHFWKDPDRVNRLAHDFSNAGLDDKDLALCRYAFDLTAHPETISENDHIAKLKKQGIKERALLDANLVIAYFNFVNRVVTGLGVELEADGGKGYDYD